MKPWIDRLITPLTTGLFLVSAVSGVALFFHWSSGTFHAMHEWLSMALLIPFALHVWKNWNALMGYLRRGYLIWPLVASLVVALPFAWGSLQGGGAGGGNPAFRAVGLMTQAPLTDIAPLLHQAPEELLAELQSKGVKAESVDESLEQMAKASDTTAMALLAQLMPAGGPARR